MAFTLHGIPVTNGIAIGKALRIAPSAMDVVHYLVDAGKEAAEEKRLLDAFKTVRQELKTLRNGLPEAAPEEMAAFLDVHAMILADPTLTEKPLELIKSKRYNAEWALATQLEFLLNQFAEIEDEYLRERATDIRQVVERVMSGYAKKAGVSGAVTLKYHISGSERHALAFTTEKKVYVNTEGGVSDLLSDYHNLESVMFHEKEHQDDQKAGKSFDDKTFEGLLNHSKIYKKQMKDKSFDRTSEDFKAGEFGAFGTYLENGLNEALKGFDEKGDTKKVTDMIKSFNEGTGKKYGYSISAKQTSFGGELIWDVDVKKTKK